MISHKIAGTILKQYVDINVSHNQGNRGKLTNEQANIMYLFTATTCIG